MGLNAKEASGGGKDFPRQPALEPGTYPCRTVQVIDLGLQPQRPFKGEEKEPAHEIMVTYEFVDEFCIDLDEDSDTYNELLEDKPRWLSETFPLYNLKSDRARSTKRYYALDPNEDAEGDWTKLINIPCNVSIVNNAGKKGTKNEGKVFENVDGVSTMRAKDAERCPELVNPPKVLDRDNPDVEIFKSLPEWLQKKITEGLDFEGTALYEALKKDPEPAKKQEKKANKKKEAEPEEEEDGEEDW